MAREGLGGQGPDAALRELPHPREQLVLQRLLPGPPAAEGPTVYQTLWERSGPIVFFSCRVVGSILRKFLEVLRKFFGAPQALIFEEIWSKHHRPKGGEENFWGFSRTKPLVRKKFRPPDMRKFFELRKKTIARPTISHGYDFVWKTIDIEKNSWISPHLYQSKISRRFRKSHLENQPVSLSTPKTSTTRELALKIKLSLFTRRNSTLLLQTTSLSSSCDAYTSSL